jgi:hypothetical protein
MLVTVRKEYRLFDSISKDFFFKRVDHFDDISISTLSPSPPIYYRSNDGVGHSENFSFVEQEDDEHFEDENKPK